MTYSLMIHGGCGALEDIQNEASEATYLRSLQEILEQGRDRLRSGDCALNVVEYCVMLLENDPLYNAGRGSVLNAQGKVEMDAAVMDGHDLRAGGVACVKNIKNPIALARRVLEQSEHVLLAAEGAMEFARAQGIETASDEYLILPARLKQLQKAQAENQVTLDHEQLKEHQKSQQKLGTVGATAWDSMGNLAAATSTGGLVNKRWGRVGDTPIIGAGVFADNETCAVSTTGYGEQFLQTVLAKAISDFVEFRQLEAAAAAQAGIDYLVRKVNGRGGVIVVDSQGSCGSAKSTSGLIHGWIERGGQSVCRLR